MRVVNVVNLMKLQPPREHPHGLNDTDFDALFTSDKPIIFAYHGYREEGTTTTPFDIVVINGMDRYSLVIDRAGLHDAPAASLKQEMRARLSAHAQYIREYGEDPPEIRDWTWDADSTEETTR